MRLHRLRLTNFKGIRSFELTPHGQNLAVYGDNGTGKTTLVDAFMWLLFDKDSQNRKDFELKTIGPDGEPIHNLEHEVEAELELDDGRRIVLRKVYQEKWTKRRGQAQREFAGHTTDHYVDGVPVKKSDYDALIADIADEKLFRLLTDPTYFNEHLHWQDRRKLLLEVCGDVTDEEVIASDPQLKDLPQILQGRSLEDHRKVILARRTEINKELDRIPVRIDEVQRALPDLSDLDREALLAERDRLQAERQAKEQERARIEAGGEIAELQRRLAEIRTAMLEVEQKARGGLDEQLRDLRREWYEVANQRDAKAAEIQRLEREAKEAADEAERLGRQMDELRSKWFEVNNQQYAGSPPAEVSDTCPACGQPLPLEHVEAARERAMAAYEEQVARFNANKAATLERISSEGKALAERRKAADQRREQILAQLETARAEHDQLAAKVDELKRTIDSLQAASPAMPPEYDRLVAEKEQVETSIARVREDKAVALQAVEQALKAIDDRLYFIGIELGRFEQRERGLARIAELEAEEKRLTQEFEELERQLHLCDLFVRAKVRLLTDRINSRFKLARFKLFDVQVNGGVAETCETTYQGVPYSSLNHGSRLNVGLDIINTLAERYGFAPPVWVDNAESVTRILPTRGQQIRLVVSAADKTLRVEQPAVSMKEAV